MFWLKTVRIEDHFCAPDVEVHLGDEGATEPTHLVFTGPNGSGKTTVLRDLARYLEFTGLMNGTWAKRNNPVHITWCKRPSGQDLDNLSFVATALFSHHVTEMRQPQGPTVATRQPPSVDVHKAMHFLQYLVNQQVQARLADDDEAQEASRIFAWFDAFERQLADLFDAPSLKLRFRRKTYDFVFDEDGREYTFHQLPSGYAAVIRILAELIMRVDALEIERDGFSGVVLIDEIDAFLHPALQEKIMPFLTGMFPKIQFVVATHSPAVATSMANAKVVSLGTGAVYDAGNLVGTPYGQLLTTLFGIETDVDLATTKELKRLEELAGISKRSLAEDQEYQQLALALEHTNHPIALGAVTQILLRQA